MACTTILVGRKASYDGSTIIARNEDSGNGEFCPKRFVVVKPEDQPRHYRSVLSHVEIELPDNPLQYTSVPNADLKEGIWGEAGVNEANVAMSATETLTSNERVLGADPLVELVKAQGKEGDADYKPEIPGGIGEEDFLTIVLPYIKTAREGVERLGALLEQYGTYEMNGVAFSDVNEIWWLETVGGHHWIAKRVPDEAYVTMPNQLGIDEFDLDDAFGDQTDHMCSEDLEDFIEENHLDLSVEPVSLFNPRTAFGSHSDADHVYNTPRAWIMQRFLNPYDEQWDGADADHRPDSDDIPWARQPERKVTIEDVKYVLSSHYQGTPFDPYGKLGDERTRHLFRPIGINRQSQLAVIQLRPYVPEGFRAIQWMAYGSNAFNTLVPFYANIDTTPKYLEDTTTRMTSENFYWANRIIAALADANFADTANAVERYQELTGSLGHATVKKTDQDAAALLGVDLSGYIPEFIEKCACDDCDCDGKTCEDCDCDDCGCVCDGDTVFANMWGNPLAVDVDKTLEATRNEQLRTLLAASNNELADKLKKETEGLLDSVLYTTSMRMRNGFNRSDH